MIRRLLLALAALGSGASGPVQIAASFDAAVSTSSAQEGAQIHAYFSPAKLGANTTVTVAFRVGAEDAASLSPLVSVEVRLPAGVTSGLDNLGIATCTPAILQLKGPGDCAPNSLMGRGSATVAVPLGSETVSERVAITIFMAPAVHERTTLLFYAHGTSPILAQNIFHGFLLGDAGLFGAKLEATIPPVAGLPGAPDVAILSMRTGIGPKGLRYHRRVHGVTVTYTPQGFKVPRTCPDRGFPVSVRLAFANGAHESSSGRIPCPTRHRSAV